MKTEELKAKLAKVEDPRRTDRGNIWHKLEDIIIIGLCTLICDGNDFADMEEIGIQRQGLLQRFLELPNGIPDSDTFRRVFEQLNPEALSESRSFSDHPVRFILNAVALSIVEFCPCIFKNNPSSPFQNPLLVPDRKNNSDYSHYSDYTPSTRCSWT